MRKAKPGQLIAYYGKAEKWAAPDICTSFESPAQSGDSKLLLFALTDAPTTYVGAGGQMQKEGRWPHQGLLKELEARGYDLETLKFSIQKKDPTSA